MKRFHLLALVLVGGVAACDRTPEPPRVEPQKPAAPPSVPSGASARPAALGAEKSRLAQPERLVAIGDLHGDLDATRDVLRLAGAIDDADRWSGGSLVVVQTGDQIDRGDEDRAVLDLLQRLSTEASAAGGALHILNGNHETMNAEGDFRYVTEPSFREFDGVDARKLPTAARNMLPEGAHARAAAFLPGGAYAEQLALRPVVLIVGDSVFVHGGLLPEHVAYGLDRLNEEVSEWLRGQRAMPEIIAGEDAPVWTRLYSTGPVPSAICKKLEQVLSSLLVRRMVVGHTIQDSGITSACGDQVFRIDVGMSDYYGKPDVAALEIADGKTRILSGSKSDAKEALPAAAE
jgi:hypothetical protein